MSFKAHRTLLISLLSIGAVIFVFGVLSLSHDFRRQVRITVQTAEAHLYSTPAQPFPAVPTRDLTPLQKKIITISKQEYARKPVSFDSTVLKYSQNTRESWCADYISWVMKQAGAPLSNPNSGSWRIPGTGTMQDYYTQRHRYVIAGSYRPQVGDVAIYRHNRSHANIVIAVKGDTMTTVGGNETGHLRVNTQPYKFGAEGLSGFGTLYP